MMQKVSFILCSRSRTFWQCKCLLIDHKCSSRPKNRCRQTHTKKLITSTRFTLECALRFGALCAKIRAAPVQHNTPSTNRVPSYRIVVGRPRSHTRPSVGRRRRRRRRQSIAVLVAFASQHCGTSPTPSSVSVVIAPQFRVLLLCV